MKRPKIEIFGTPIPMSAIDATAILQKSRPSKKEIDTLAEELNKEGLVWPIVVLQEDPATQRFALLAGRKRYLAAQKLNWAKIMAITIPKVPKNLEDRVVELVELCRRNETSGYDLAEIGAALEQGLFVETFRLSTGYAYNLIRWFNRSIPEVKKAWKEDQPLINQQELEKMIKMEPAEAREYWTRRQETGGLGEGFHPNKKPKTTRSPKAPPRATPDQLSKLIAAVINSPLCPPAKDLALAITRYALGWQREIPGIFMGGGKPDYDNLDALLRDTKRQKA
jgi:hypothetical protein